MENVLGLRSFGGGSLLKEVTSDLTRLGYEVAIWDLKTDQYAIPQRRRRLLVVGSQTPLEAPPQITPAFKNGSIAAVSVRDAISDLPSISTGGGETPVVVELPEASSPYQKYVRGDLRPDEYLRMMRADLAGAEQIQMKIV
jgi:DNA (cytosine-5)-methyltransferase 1